MPDVKTDKRFVPYMVAEQPSLVAIKQAKILLTNCLSGNAGRREAVVVRKISDGSVRRRTCANARL